MKNEGKLTIIFCSFFNRDYFGEFIINGEHFKTNTEKINLKYIFNKYEQDLGKKCCSYKLVSKNGVNMLCGTFEIFLGNNIGYCFLDEIGITFEIMFLEKDEKIKDLINSKITSKIKSISGMNKEIEHSLNQNETKDRASLILINCLPNTQIKRNGELLFDLNKIEKKIVDTSDCNGYNICFYYSNFNDFVYQKIEEVKQISFNDAYEKYHEIVDELYNILINIINNKNSNLIKDFYFIYNKNKKKLKEIILNKYLYGKKILEEDLNEDYYFEFAFKIIFFLSIESNENTIEINELEDIHKKLLENKKIISADDYLKVYEKIFLLMDIYSSDIIYEGDSKIHYFHIKNIDKNSPLYYCYEFLDDFIENLNYNSSFYYPLLSIDGGYYEYNFKKKNGTEHLSSFGFNMLSLDMIKYHLKNMIPNFIIWSENLSDDEDAITNPLNGNIILNINKFKNIKIDKNQCDEYLSQHYAFILSKILIHEFFGHKKSSFSKTGINFDSIISFRNELGELKLIDGNSKDKFINVDEIENGNNKASEMKGDSGYFIEYFLGSINGEYTIAIIDTIENKTNLCKLLNSSLWHQEISTFKEYVKLKSIFLDLYPDIIIDNSLNIYEQIQIMKAKLIEITEKNYDKEPSSNSKIKLEINKSIDEQFNIIWKKRKKLIISKRKDTPSIKKDDKKKVINDVKKSLFAGFTHGFYRK